jgi:hypothetical protein
MNFILHMDVNNLEEIYTIEEQSFIGRLPELMQLSYLTLFYTRGLEMLVLHVMVSQPYRFSFCFLS